jgi:hypothetical protein
MEEGVREQSCENILAADIPDDALEYTAGIVMVQANAITLWTCTALYFCPGP